MYLTMRQLRAFLEVAELGSFTRAAERLNIAQPALSGLVRALEGELGLKLFDRTTRRVELTEAGREFRGSVETILVDLNAAVRGARDRAERRRGRITVAAPPLLAAAILPGAIAAFREALPGVTVALVDARADLIVAGVRAGEVDCAVGTFRTDEDGLSRTRLSRDEIMVFLRPNAPLAERGAVRWGELADVATITLTRDSGVRALVDLGFEAVGARARPAFEVSQITTALALADAGLGVALLPTYSAVPARTYDLVWRPLIEPRVTRDICLIAPAGRSNPPALDTFIRILKARMAAFDPTA